jgi:NAD(P)-dependent dehydrogenase (short-subunit alcohol dehydrogenase family)
MTSQSSKFSAKVAFLTGSTSGIGRATAQELVKHISTLILPVRNLTKGENLKKELLIINPNCQIDLYQCDLESIESMKTCARAIASKYKTIDILINNAGIFDYQCHFTKDGLESHFEINVLSQYIFNTVLKPLVLQSSQGRIINLTGLSHKAGKFNLQYIQDSNKSPKSFINTIRLCSDSCLYRNLLTFKLAKDLENTKVTVNCLHPGSIKSNIGKDTVTLTGRVLTPIFNLFAKSATEGAKTSLYLALSEEGGQISRKYWSDSKIDKPSELSTNMDLAEQLEVKCRELTKI